MHAHIAQFNDVRNTICCMCGRSPTALISKVEDRSLADRPRPPGQLGEDDLTGEWAWVINI